jgi:uncharacterized protein DUF6603
VTAELDRATLDHVDRLLAPLSALRDADGVLALLDVIGWDAATVGLDPTQLATAVGDLETARAGLQTLVEAQKITISDLGGVLPPLALGIGELIEGIASASATGAASEQDLGKLGEDLTGYLVVHYLASSWPRVCICLKLLGLLKPEPLGAITAADGRVLRRPVVRLVLDLSVLGRALRDPLGYVKEQFISDSSGNTRLGADISDLVGPLLADALVEAGVAASYAAAPPDGRPALTAAEAAALAHLLVVDLSVAPDDDANAHLRAVTGMTDLTSHPGEVGLLVGVSGDVSATAVTPIGSFTMDVRASGPPIVISAHGVEVQAGAPAVHASLDYRTDAAMVPAVRFGAPDGLRFEIGALEVKVGLDAGATPDVTGSVDVEKFLLAIQGGDGDGFLAKMLPRDPIKLTGDVGLDVGLRSGVRFRGSAMLEYRFPVKLLLGPLEVQEVQVALSLSAAGVTFGLSGTLGLAIGPLQAVVEELGVALRLREAVAQAGQTAPAGNVGAYNLDVGFKPPKGAGLSIKAGPVTGGGYIFFDPDNEQYAGILQLGFQAIGITAIALLTTRLPDASGPPGATKKGFSLLIIIAVDLPPIQLGYGFTLNGVGGLLGVHRTMVVDALRNGVRDGSVNAILFPQDPIKRAAQIISQLRSIFPPAEGRFVFGPMVKIGWGPNAILELSAAIVLELTGPIRLVILGRIQAALPDKKSTVLNLRLDVVGVVDFDRGEVSIDASLVDSRLTAFVLTGDMALRVGWGASKIFALAAGGFHPRFQPPPGFPSLRRLAIALGDSDNPRLRMETYLALTANTIQFGAAVDAYVRMDTPLGTFSAAANMTFDALIQFQPFELTAELGASIDILYNNVPRFHAALHATFTGPTPWHAIGYAVFNFLGDHRIEFEATVGEPAQPPRLEIKPVDVLAKLVEAFSRPDAWAALPPTEANRIVTIGDLEPGAAMVVHPLGSLSARQRILPLGKSIDRFGTATVAPTTFALDGFQSTAGATQLPAEMLYDDFAPGQFTALSDDERLARPAFESMRSGGRVAVTGTSLPADGKLGKTAVMGYDEAIVDVEPDTRATSTSAPTAPAATIPDRALAELVHGGAAAAAETRISGSAAFRGPDLGVAVLPERYLVAGADTLTPAPGAPNESSAEAHDRLAKRTATDPPAQAVPAREAA